MHLGVISISWSSGFASKQKQTIQSKKYQSDSKVLGNFVWCCKNNFDFDFEPDVVSNVNNFIFWIYFNAGVQKCLTKTVQKYSIENVEKISFNMNWHLKLCRHYSII